MYFKISKLLIMFTAVLVLGTVVKEPQLYKTINTIKVYDIPEQNTYMFTSGFKIDANGAPMAYNKGDSKKYADTLRYGNAQQIPFIVLPLLFSKDFKPGDIAYVFNKKNSRGCFAIFAGVRSKDALGKGSVYLAQQLGISISPKSGGADNDICYFLFKNSGSGKHLSREEIITIGKARYEKDNIAEIID